MLHHVHPQIQCLSNTAIIIKLPACRLKILRQGKPSNPPFIIVLRYALVGLYNHGEVQLLKIGKYLAYC
jgi:hypothetical protein